MANDKKSNPSGGKIVTSGSDPADVGMFVKTTSMQDGGKYSGKRRRAKSSGKMEKTAAAGIAGPSVSRMPSQYYHPLYEETNIQLPREPRETNQWCFVPETMVLMDDGTEKRIDEITVGDCVITHTGSLGQVTNVWVREIDEDINWVKASGCNSLGCTDGHEIFSYKKDEINCKYFKNRTTGVSRCRPQQLSVCKYCDVTNIVQHKKRKAVTLQVGDCLFTPIVKKEVINKDISDDFLKLLGYYTAEGNIISVHGYDMGLNFAIHINEYDTLGKEIKELCKSVYNKEPSVKNKKNDNNCCELVLYSVKAAADMKKHAGCFSGKKKLSADIIYLAPERIQKFLKTLVNGDGYIRPLTMTNGGMLEYATASNSLASQFSFIANRCGVVARKYHREKRYSLIRTNGKLSHIYGDDLPVRTMNRIKINPHDVNALLGECITKVDTKVRKDRFIFDDKIIMPIRSIKRCGYKGKVFNLEVYNIEKNNNGEVISSRSDNNDHSYIANGIAVGNSRHFYKTDPIVATGLDFHAQFPITAFYLDMKDQDPYIKRYYEDMCDDIRLKQMLLYISHEYWVLGNVFPFGEWDTNEGKWKRLVLLNPDFVSLKSSVFSGEPQLELSPDPKLTQIVNSRQPRDVFEQLPSEIVTRVARGEKIPLNPDHVSHIAHKLNYYDEYGTPIMYRLFKVLMYKDRLREAQFAIAERHITPIQLWLIGEKGNEANDDDIANFKELLDQIYMDRNAAMVYGHYLKYEAVGSNNGIYQLNQEFEYIEKEILFGLGLSANTINGESGAFQQSLVALEALINRYVIFRELLATYVEQKIFKPVAEEQGFTKKDSASGEDRLVYPRLKWSKMNLRDDTQQKTILVNLRQQKNVSIKSVLKLFDMDYEEEKKNLEEEMFTIFNPNVQAVKSQEAVRPTLPNIPSYMDRNDLNSPGALGKQWRDYVEATTDKELEDKVEKGELTREDADQIRVDVIEETTIGQSVSILRQIEDSVTAELAKSNENLTPEQYTEAKFKIMNEVGKEHQVAGVGILVEIIKNAEEYFKQQVDAGTITQDQADQMKYEIVEDVAKDEMRRIINAAMSIRERLIKTAAASTKIFQTQLKMGEIVKRAEKKIASLSQVVEEAFDDNNKNI